MNAQLLEALRADLLAADYSSRAVAVLWGSAAESARLRGALVPARKRLAEQPATPVATLARLFLLGESVTGAETDAALPALGSAGATELGIVSIGEDGRCRALLSLNPVALPDPLQDEESVDWWVLSDLDDHLRAGPAKPDHVMGVGGATRSLLAQAPLHLAGGSRRALDLGTGCGIVALQLARAGADTVVATDISERALELARANAVLGGMVDRIDFRLGSLFEPVKGEIFDLILSNPPFVITPRSADEEEPYEYRDSGDAPRYLYRDGGLTGDDLAATVVRQAPIHLADGGTLLCLANWEVPWGGDGLERVRGWIEEAEASLGETGGGMGGAELEAWTIERDRVDPARYAETWARDGGARPGTPEFEELLGSWLDDFAARRIVGIGLGSIRVRRGAGRGAGGDARERSARLRSEQSLGVFATHGAGRALQEAFDAGIAAARMDDAELLGTRWLVHPRVAEEREHRPGAEEPRAIHLVIDTPIGQRVGVDTLLAAAIGACDGELALGRIAGALATLLEVDEGEIAERLAADVRELAWLGMVRPVFA